MKKITYLLCGLFGLTAYAAPVQSTPATLQSMAGIVTPVESVIATGELGLSNVFEMQAPEGSATQRREVRREGEETPKLEQFVASQSFMRDKTFVWTGGTSRGYDVSVVRDGNVVKFNKLFDMEGLSTMYNKGEDEEILGVYDPEAKTVTIPTAMNLAYGTKTGYIGNWCTCVMMGCAVNEKGQVTRWDSEVVFKVHGDFESLTTDQNIALIPFYNTGESLGGVQDVFRQFNIYVAQDEPKLVAFDQEITINKAYVGTEKLGGWSVINVSNSPVDYITEVATPGCISFAESAGQLPPRSITNVDLAFNPTEVGEFTFSGSLTYETSTSEETLSLSAKASSEQQPDFSAIQKGDPFKLVTYIETPAEMMTDKKGNPYARVSAKGKKNTMCKLQALLNVPEGYTGTLNWKADNENPGQSHFAVGGVLLNHNGTEVLGALSYNNAKLDGSYVFGPGDHIASFQYEQITKTDDPAYGMNVHEVEFVLTEASKDAHELVTEKVNFGGYMINETAPLAEGTSYIKIRNVGTNPLSVTSVKSDNDKFTPTTPSGSVELYKVIDVPVLFSATEIGHHTANITVETSAGTLTVPVEAMVRQMDDFTQIITAGKEFITSITTDGNVPFIMKDGKAVNSNAGMPDAADNVTESKAALKFEFEVPKGKTVQLSWEGWSYGNSPDPIQYWLGDKSNVCIKSGSNLYSKEVWGDASASSADNWYDDFWSNCLVCGPGKHYIEFWYSKNGDGITSEKDCLELSSLALTPIAMQDYGFEVMTPEVVFDPIYVGPKRATAKIIEIKNTGSLPLEMTGEMVYEAPFIGAVSTMPVTFGNSTQVAVYFNPQEEGEYEGDVVFKSNAGDITIHCKGSTKPAAGLALIGDFEDGGEGWTWFDQDADLDCWMPLTKLFGDLSSDTSGAYTHEGAECYGSGSIDKTGTKPITPDNWLISPAVNVPAEGAILDWWVAAHYDKFNAEHYSVYVLTPELAADHVLMETGTCIFSETLAKEFGNKWQYRACDLKDYAGQTVHIAFRHHECTGQYVLKIDDVFVRAAKNDAVAGIEADGQVVAREYYDAAGMRLTAPVQGVNLVRTVYSNGAVKVAKEMVK